MIVKYQILVLQSLILLKDIDMAKVYGAVEINVDRCKGCNLCVEACPCDVLSLTTREVNGRGYPFARAIDPEKCIGCAACAMVCPDSCIEVYRLVDTVQNKIVTNNMATATCA